MGKKGHFTLKKKALNIRKGLCPHLAHPSGYATDFLQNQIYGQLSYGYLNQKQTFTGVFRGLRKNTNSYLFQ